jgi:hypothetical protein
MEVAPGTDNGEQARLMFGPEPGSGGTYLVVRNGVPQAHPRRLWTMFATRFQIGTKRM